MSYWTEDIWEEPDELFYHKEYRVNKVLGETDKSVLLDLKSIGEIWVPKSIIVGDWELYNLIDIHEETLDKIIEKRNKKSFGEFG